MRKLMLGGMTVLLAACAAPPVAQRFELIDAQARVWPGEYDTLTQRMRIVLADGSYSGFYIVATETVSATAFPFHTRRAWPLETRGSIVSNTARAHLRSETGANVACEFVFDGPRAVGSCARPGGEKYQFVAGQ